MGLTIVRNTQGAMPTVLADRRLYLTADRRRVVEHGSPDAALLFATPGMPLPVDEAERYGLTVVEGHLVVQAEAPATAAHEDVEAPPRAAKRGGAPRKRHP